MGGAPPDGDGDGGEDPPGDGPREVVVPLRLYKTVTVFSTLFAVVAVVGGFALLDVATQRASAASDEVNVPLALVGLALIAGGGLVYAYSSRFRAEGMGGDDPPGASESADADGGAAGKGKDKTPADEPADDG